MADRINFSNEPGPSLEQGPSLTSLVSGIVNDLQVLIRQEIQLARTEMQKEWAKTKSVAGSMIAGAALLSAAGILFCFMLVYILDKYTAIPLWACFGIIGLVLAIAGGFLIAAGRARASDIHVVPPQTAETMRENVQWIQNQT